MKTLNENQKAIVNVIVDEAMNLVEEHAEGQGFVRINLYKNAKNELLQNGETELEICGAHFFSSSQWDDIDKDNQIEIGNFKQDEMNWVEGEGDGTWRDTERGHEWLCKMYDAIEENVVNVILNNIA